MRNFNEWIENFKESIADYKYYVDFDKVYAEVDKIKVELNIMNSLIGSQNIENDFESLLKEYPQILKCIPILIAKREKEIIAIDEDGSFNFNFNYFNYSISEYKMFMRKTGLFELISNRIINNLVDYVLGVESGLSSNGRKNRGGHLMENIVEGYLKKSKLTYFKEMDLRDIETKWGIDLSQLSNDGKSSKRFDFVVKTSSCIYAIECNFYSSGGSKLNETARSYKMLALESKNIKGFKFVWFTDGIGWKSARKNLEETFDVLEDLYSIHDLENDIISKVIK
ncbi:MAG TPA: type II restriction endonuclease [Bacilli bacterium]|nr:MAG: Type-2 restriction enzyme DpnII [Tenericutes bacterium ADurb.BinA124]HPX83819.1 type II restriction endonuclease [Bacilli bacterium]